MRKLTTWETKEVFVIINMEIRGIIIEMWVGTTLEMVGMIDHQTESKETGKTKLGIEMIVVMCMFPQVVENEQMVVQQI